MKARHSVPASLRLFLRDLTLKEEGVHDDKFKIPTVARAVGINLQQNKYVRQPLPRRRSPPFGTSLAG